LLTSFLNSHPNIRARGEILRKLDGRRTAIEIADGAFGRAPRSIKAKGFKIFYYHPNGEMDTGIWEHLTGMDGLHVIHLKRRNLLRTLISRKIAGDEGVWKVKDARTGERTSRKQVSFTVEELTRDFERTRRWERDGDALFRDHPLVSVHYEDIVQRTEPTFRTLTDFLGVPYVKPRTRLVRQNPETTTDLVVNHAELAAAFEGSEWRPFFDE
jgi:LPS sulfotransferase NodH